MKTSKRFAALTMAALAGAPAYAGASDTAQQAQQALAVPTDQLPEAFGQLFDNSALRASAVADPSASGRPGGNSHGRQGEMLAFLDTVASVFKAQYAPAQWKKEHLGWDLDTEVAKAKQAVLAAPNMTERQFQGVVRDLLKSAQDYHVSIQFYATESAALPLLVLPANGRYYIAWINRAKLPADSFPFQVGDELTQFGGQKPEDVVRALEKQLGGNVPSTDHALGSMMLTGRAASSGLEVPSGPVVLSIKPQGSDKPLTYQLIWNHAPEQVGPMLGSQGQDGISAGPGAPRTNPMPDADNMGSPLARSLADAAGPNPFQIGARRSFVPPLGTKIWESDAKDPLHAYIYRSPVDKKIIGYVRIPSYEPGDDQATAKVLAQFADIVNRFQDATDGLVIDQVNNGGGSVFYMYTLASMLTDQSLRTLQYQIAITQKDVNDAAGFLATVNDVSSDADAKNALGPAFSGSYPVTYELAVHLREFARFIRCQWGDGDRWGNGDPQCRTQHTVTDPTYLYGVDRVNPSTVAHYTKPILLLINELDFSCADFFPAIMQDNKRATLFGQRTAGAGGTIHKVEIPNRFGIENFVVTHSIVARADGSRIENLGVTPDIPYNVTAGDLQNGFSDYAQAVNKAIGDLVDKAAVSP